MEIVQFSAPEAMDPLLFRYLVYALNGGGLERLQGHRGVVDREACFDDEWGANEFAWALRTLGFKYER